MLSRVQVAALAGRVHNHPIRGWGSALAAGQGLVEVRRHNEISLVVRAQPEGMFSYF